LNFRAHNLKVTSLSPVPATKYKVIKNSGLVFLNRFFVDKTFELLIIDVQNEQDLE